MLVWKKKLGLEAYGAEEVSCYNFLMFVSEIWDFV